MIITKPVQFFNTNPKDLENPEIKRILDLINRCVSQFQFPNTFDTQLKVIRTTNEMGELVVFSLYTVSERLPKSAFNIFELTFSTFNNEFKYLLYSHTKQHSIKRFEELRDLIIEIIESYDFSGINVGSSKTNKAMKRTQKLYSNQLGNKTRVPREKYTLREWDASKTNPMENRNRAIIVAAIRQLTEARLPLRPEMHELLRKHKVTGIQKGPNKLLFKNTAGSIFKNFSQENGLSDKTDNMSIMDENNKRKKN